MRPTILALLAAGLFAGAPIAAAQQRPAPIEYYRLVPGFVAEARNAIGLLTGSGFVKANPWGQYTAYLLSTNAKGQRTWRIEHDLPMGPYTQGSTIYLLEGSNRALLIDTGNPAAETEGVNDLKTLANYLLGHENDGSVRAHPLDFVVANTHSHGDHTGENARMSDRTLYYMDLDWPKVAPANYVPIREGGGATKNGGGTAVGEIDLGDRLIKAVAIPPHTPGSTGYLDAENQMLFSGDAMGSSYPWLHWAPIAIYARSTAHVAELTRDMPYLAVLPAHFYQIWSLDRAAGPFRPLDRQYVLDEHRIAEALIAGTLEGEPYPAGGTHAYWAALGSGHIVYSLDLVDEPGTAPAASYRSVRIPGGYHRDWGMQPAYFPLFDVKAELHLLRGPKGETMPLLIGSRAALLIGTGSGAPGLAAKVKALAGGKPLEVALTSGDPAQLGGLAQLRPARVYAPAGVALPHGARATRLTEGAAIDLGTDGAGRPLRLSAAALPGHRADSMTLLEPANALLFAGDALGDQGGDSGLTLSTAPAAYAAALAKWRHNTDGRYATIFTSGSTGWFLPPAYVDQLASAAARAASGDAKWRTESKRHAGGFTVRSDGTPDIVASIAVAP